ncbi:unnamed protein product [Cuscuta campestris]|uniref:Nucleoporin autopeptidase n=1 Tax=Cuscuta campestris TaxID=132261 RepID=A0A484NDI3_9ASTE|nr:unnamed protein product [Cuscuta campestris]
MFGSTNAFGQSSTSPFGSQSAFGQTSNNPFAPKPFGGKTPFGSNTGSSLFGGNSTGVFGATQSSSPLGTTQAFGASSPAFGSTTPSFGASSTPAFGNSSSAFGSSPRFGQKPGFGGFGSSTPQPSAFGSSFQQSQPAFGSNLFGSSTPFGAQSQPAFGTPSTPTFGSSSTPALGASAAPTFGAPSTPGFGTTASPNFGSTGSPFGISSAPIFGSPTPAFGTTSSAPAFGTSTPAFGTATSPAFGSTTTQAFGNSSTPFNVGSTPAFGQSSSAFSSSPFNTTPSSFAPQSSAFGASASAPPFGTLGFAGQPRGSRVAPYQPTPETDSGSTTTGKVESISAMPVYKDKSHEELRFEDYQAGDKGGPALSAQSTGGNSFGQSSANPFSSTTPSPFAPKSTFAVSTTPAFSTAFGTSTTPNPFGSTSLATSLFGSSPSSFVTNTTPIFGQSSTSGFGQSTSVFGSSAQGTTPAFGSSLAFNTQSTPLFQSTTPSFGQTGTFGQTGAAFGQTSSSFGQSTPPFGQPSLFNTPSTGFGGNLFSSTPSMQNTKSPLGFGQTTSSLSTLFQPPQPSQNTTTGFAAPNIFGAPSMFGQNNFLQPSTTQNSLVLQPAPVSNPFGTLPAMPQVSIGQKGNSPSIQYGISNLPVIDKPAPVRISPLLTSRHLSQRRPKLPARNYTPIPPGGHKLAFFTDGEVTTSTPKVDAIFIPWDNPRALVIRPLETWPSRASVRKPFSATEENGKVHEDASASLPNGVCKGDKENGFTENGSSKETTRPLKENRKPNGVHGCHPTQKGGSWVTLTSHRAGEAAIVYEHGADIEALMPKLRHPDYYTLPRIQELAAKERAEPGFCRHVSDFVVGRKGFGCIRFIGDTDVRRLDLESIVQFNNREVIVYVDESKKPAVGQGLNKPAEVTLLNIKCSDKKTGKSCTDGPRVEKYKEMLRRKAEDQGAEFVSYDPVNGEWKFRVKHFSRYWLGDDEDEETPEPEETSSSSLSSSSLGLSI